MDDSKWGRGRAIGLHPFPPTIAGVEIKVGCPPKEQFANNFAEKQRIRRGISKRGVSANNLGADARLLSSAIKFC
jgi:hypothetical protein